MIEWTVAARLQDVYKRQRYVLVARHQRENELHGCSCGNGGVRGECATLLVYHEVFNFGAVYLDFLRFEHKRHEGGVLALKAEQLVVYVGFDEIAGSNTAGG